MEEDDWVAGWEEGQKSLRAPARGEGKTSPRREGDWSEGGGSFFGEAGLIKTLSESRSWDSPLRVSTLPSS